MTTLNDGSEIFKDGFTGMKKDFTLSISFFNLLKHS